MGLFDCYNSVMVQLLKVLTILFILMSFASLSMAKKNLTKKSMKQSKKEISLVLDYFKNQEALEIKSIVKTENGYEVSVLNSSKECKRYKAQIMKIKKKKKAFFQERTYVCL